MEFIGFYVNCNSKDLKIYETKLINPLSEKLQQKHVSELINIYHILDNQNNLVFHNKGSNSEKIDQKSQNVFDSFIMLSSQMVYSVQRRNKPEDFFETMSVSLNERALQMDQSSIITLDNTLIMNEQESIDYYIKTKNSKNSVLDFNLEIEQPTDLNKEDSLLIKGEYLIKALVHKKATIAECKKV